MKKLRDTYESQIYNDKKLNKFIVVILFSFCFSILILFYANNLAGTTYSKFNIEEDTNINSTKYILEDNIKCKILDMDPFDSQVKRFHKREKYVKCTKKELLTYITKENNIATLHLKETALRFYGKRVSCCYSIYFRDAECPEKCIRQLPCVYFKNDTTLGEDFIEVACKNSTNGTVYKNTHAPIVITKKVEQKLLLTKNKSRAFSVLLLGIDSVSRLNFIRSLPNSYKFLMDNEWISFKGYNKIDDNTYPNVMAILTGNNQDDKKRKCNYKNRDGLNKCPMIWYDFRNLGYVTAYAEDETVISTFNLRKKGFMTPPTDYYFRPYFQISENELGFRKIEKLKYCTGPETAGERVLNLAKDFTSTFIDYLNFGLFWMNSFSHNVLNMVSMMDDKIRQFLQDISNAGVLENSFVIFLSDHGLRAGEFRQSSMGWLEERLPFFFLWVPHRFRRMFPEEYSNIKSNSHKLTSPYDLYMTLQHLLIMSEFNYTQKPSYDCPKCNSLFKEIQKDRSCKDAGIAPHWCACSEFTRRNQNDETVRNAALFLIDGIHQTILKHKEGYHCGIYTLHKIIAASFSKEHLLVVIETRPGAVFESLMPYKLKKNDVFEFISTSTSRIDKYSKHSNCVKDRFLEKFCYCASSDVVADLTTEKSFSSFGKWRNATTPTYIHYDYMLYS